MAELLVDFITSLDGYGAAEGWPGWWGLEGAEYLAWLADQAEGAYPMLMGATTYRLMHGVARSSGRRRGSASSGEPGSDALPGMSRIVSSGTRSEPLEWSSSTLVTGDP